MDRESNGGMQRIRALQSSGILCYLALEWWYYYYQRRRVARLITSAPPMNIHKNTRAVVALVQKNGGMQAVLTRVLHLGKTLRHVQHMQTAENVEQMMVGAESSDLHPAHVLSAASTAAVVDSRCSCLSDVPSGVYACN